MSTEAGVTILSERQATRSGRAFALHYPDPVEGLTMHPVTAGYQLTIAQLFADAGRHSGAQGWDDTHHYAFLRGVVDGVRERTGRLT